MSYTNEKKSVQSSISTKPTTLNLQPRSFAPFQSDLVPTNQVTNSEEVQKKENSLQDNLVVRQM